MKVFWFLMICCMLVTGGARAGETVIVLTSSVFPHGGTIPVVYTSRGENVSPPLSWAAIPADTESLALICDDPDAPRGTWTHWVIYNIPPTRTGIPENLPRDALLPNGARQGINDFGMYGWDGPAPPSGTHQYVFTIYALDTMLDLAPGATKTALLEAMRGHVLGRGKLIGTFGA